MKSLTLFIVLLFSTFTYTASAQCQASFTPSFQGSNIQFLNNSTGPYQQVFWDFGDGTISTIISPWHQFTQPGIYTVCLTVGDSSTSCFDTYCQNIAYQGTGNCDATFSFVDSSGFIWFYPTTFQSNLSYFWNFGDGNSSTQVYPVHQYANPGTYLACLTVIDSANNCFDTYCDSVSNLPPTGCMAGFSYQVANGTSYFNGFNIGLGSVSSYAWIFGDGTTGTGQSPQHSYANPGTYNVCLVISTFNGCVDSVCNTIQIPISSNCDAQFQYFDSLGTYYFFPINHPNYYYHWNFGDGFVSNAMYPSHFYSSSGWYNVCLTVIDSLNNCSDSWCDSIFIPNGNGCQAYFTNSVDSVTGAITFNNQSQGNYTNMIWAFGDGTSSMLANPTHTYALPGTYIACLTILGNNCQDSYCDSIVIGSGVNCIPMFYAVPDTLFGNGNVTFYIANSCPSWQYVWSFGDSTNGSGVGPFIHQYSATGWYYICVTAYDNFGNVLTYCDSVYALRLSTGLNETINTQTLQLFPNPTRGDFQLKFELTKASSIIIEILSIQGQLIQSRAQEHPSGVSQMRFDLSALESGMYMIRIKTAEQQINSRFSIQQ